MEDEGEENTVPYPSPEDNGIFSGDMFPLVDIQYLCGHTGYAAAAGRVMEVQSSAAEAGVL